MTEEQKDKLIAKMIDTPSLLTDEEVLAILENDELRDIYEMSSEVADACLSQPDFDMEEEWNRFRTHMHRKPLLTRWVMRVAAIFLGVILISGIAIKFSGRFFTASTKQQVVANVDKPVVSEQSSCSVNNQQKQDENVVENNITSVRKESGTVVKSLPGNKNSIDTEDINIDEEMDIDEYLRIQQARVDNDLALQTAEIYKDEYQAILQMFDILGEKDDEIINEMMQVTLQ